jgi:RimJ/RimL family protein N-acetyltransferase
MITIRKASTADASAIAYVHHISRKAAYQSFVSADELDKNSLPALQAHWVEQMQKAEIGKAHVWVIEEDGDVYGVATMGKAPQAVGAAEIGHFYLDPELWGQGHGQKLLAAVIEQARLSGYKRLNLWVFEGNERGRRFYELAGFAQDNQPDTQGNVNPQLHYTIDLTQTATRV